MNRNAALEASNIVIVEDDPNGHRLVYVRLLVEFAVEAGAKVTVVVTPNVRTAESWRHNIEPLLPLVHVHEVDSVDAGVLSRTSRTLHADHTLVPDADFLAMRVGATGGWRGVGSLTMLVMRDPDDEVPETLKRRLTLGAKSLLIRRARRVSGVRIVGLRSALDRSARDVDVALDPVSADAGSDDVARIRRDWNVTSDRFWYGVVGSVTARKNLPLVAEAACEAAAMGDGSTTGFLVAGSCEAGVLDSAAPHLERLRDLGVVVVIQDRLLDNIEVDAAVQALDCLVIAYSNEAPSGMIARAALHGIRVVAAGARSLARDVANLPAAKWTPLQASALAAAMHEIRLVSGPIEHLELGPEQFCAALLRPTPSSTPTAPAEAG